MNEEIKAAESRVEFARLNWRASSGTPQRDAAWKDLLEAKRDHMEVVKRTTVATPIAQFAFKP